MPSGRVGGVQMLLVASCWTRIGSGLMSQLACIQTWKEFTKLELKVKWDDFVVFVRAFWFNHSFDMQKVHIYLYSPVQVCWKVDYHNLPFDLFETMTKKKEEALMYSCILFMLFMAILKTWFLVTWNVTRKCNETAYKKGSC